MTASGVMKGHVHEVLKDSRLRGDRAGGEAPGAGGDGRVSDVRPKGSRKLPRPGAVEQLLILDSLVREKDVEALMRSVEDARGRVTIVSEMHEGGKKLESLGGMAALLRYKVSS